MIDDIRDVIVVGGGISGLTAAWHLKQAGIDVCLLEAAADVGGCTRTERRDGFLLEKGPFNVIVRDPTFQALLEAVEDEVQVVTADRAVRKRYLYRRGRLHAVPSDPVHLATSGLLSLGAKARMVTGLLASRRSDGSEETIEQVGTRRFGKEVTDTMISALVSGIFAGDIRRLNLAACFPTVARIDREARSLIGYGLFTALRSKRAKKGAPRRRWRGLVSLDGGLGALGTALARPLGADCICGCRIDTLRPADDGFELVCRDGDSAVRSLRCHRLVLASPADETADLLGPVVPKAAGILKTIYSAPMIVLNLGFRREDVGHPLDGFGFLVPQNEPEFPLMGVLWADSVFPHYAPRDHRLLRVFIGGSRTPEAIADSDDQLLATAMDAGRELLQLSADPMLVDVCRYRAAIPQYELGYLDKVARLNALIAGQPNLYLVGNYLEGVSLNDCVRCATRVAREIARTTAKTETARAPAMAVS